MNFGAASGPLIDVAGSTLFAAAGFTISGGGDAAMHIRSGSYATLDTQTITVTGTPAFTAYFFGTADGSHTSALHTTITGAATGKRFWVHYDSSVRTSNTGAASASFFPGDVAGTLQRGGVFDDLGGNLLGAGGTPASAAAACDQGQITYDSSYLYLCVATNTWKRAALATW
jgi:hypothetical protein